MSYMTPHWVTMNPIAASTRIAELEEAFEELHIAVNVAAERIKILEQENAELRKEVKP